VRTRKLLLGLGLAIAGTLLTPSARWVGSAMVVAGAVFTWLALAPYFFEKPWPAWKQKTMQAVLGLCCVAVALTVLRIPIRGMLYFSLLGAAAGWFVPYFLSRRKSK
jgi:FtsH-binding integral membrane protein